MGTLHPFAHLVRRLARVGEDELPAGADADRREPVEPLDDDSRLAAARAGEHETGAVAVVDGDALLIVEHAAGGRVGDRETSHRVRFWAALAT